MSENELLARRKTQMKKAIYLVLTAILCTTAFVPLWAEDSEKKAFAKIIVKEYTKLLERRIADEEAEHTSVTKHSFVKFDREMLQEIRNRTIPAIESGQFEIELQSSGLIAVNTTNRGITLDAPNDIWNRQYEAIVKIRSANNVFAESMIAKAEKILGRSFGEMDVTKLSDSELLALVDEYDALIPIYIALRNEYLQRISASTGVELAPLPAITPSITLDVMQARTVVHNLNSNNKNPIWRQIRRQTEPYRYITAEAAEFFCSNLEKLNNMIDNVVLLQSDAARHFANTGKFLAFHGLQTLSYATAKELGRHEGHYIYMYDIEFLSPRQAGALFRHKEYINFQDLAHMDTATAEAIANNRNREVDIGNDLDSQERRIWGKVATKYGWHMDIEHSLRNMMMRIEKIAFSIAREHGIPTDKEDFAIRIHSPLHRINHVTCNDDGFPNGDDLKRQISRKLTTSIASFAKNNDYNIDETKLLTDVTRVVARQNFRDVWSGQWAK